MVRERGLRTNRAARQNSTATRSDRSEEIAELLEKAIAFSNQGGDGGTARQEQLTRSDVVMIRSSISNGWQTPPEVFRSNVSRLIDAVNSDHHKLAESALVVLKMMDDRELLDGGTK